MKLATSITTAGLLVASCSEAFMPLSASRGVRSCSQVAKPISAPLVKLMAQESDEENEEIINEAPVVEEAMTNATSEELEEAVEAVVEEAADEIPIVEEEEEVEEEASAEEVVAEVEEKPSTSTRTPEENWTFLQTLGAISGRGEYATATQKKAAAQTVEALESSMEGEAAPAELYGRWELVYSSTQLFRSSPFFMAGRAVCTTAEDAKRYNWFCDMHRAALAMSQIQAVRQIVTRSGRLVSEFEVSAGTVPFVSSYAGGLPVAITGALVSSADYELASNATTSDLQLYMDTVEVKGSNIPGVRQLLDQPAVKLESRRLADTLEKLVSSYKTPRPVFRTTYLDEQFRIGRDQDDNIFVYIKTSSDDTVTDYADVPADLGVKALLDGLRGAFSS